MVSFTLLVLNNQSKFSVTDFRLNYWMLLTTNNKCQKNQILNITQWVCTRKWNGTSLRKRHAITAAVVKWNFTHDPISTSHSSRGWNLIGRQKKFPTSYIKFFPRLTTNRRRLMRFCMWPNVLRCRLWRENVVCCCVSLWWGVGVVFCDSCSDYFTTTVVIILVFALNYYCSFLMCFGAVFCVCLLLSLLFPHFFLYSVFSCKSIIRVIYRYCVVLACGFYLCCCFLNPFIDVIFTSTLTTYCSLFPSSRFDFLRCCFVCCL